MTYRLLPVFVFLILLLPGVSYSRSDVPCLQQDEGACPDGSLFSQTSETKCALGLTCDPGYKVDGIQVCFDLEAFGQDNDITFTFDPNLQCATSPQFCRGKISFNSRWCSCRKGCDQIVRQTDTGPVIGACCDDAQTVCGDTGKWDEIDFCEMEFNPPDRDGDGFFPSEYVPYDQQDTDDSNPCVPDPDSAACVNILDEDGDGYSPSYSEGDPLYDPDDSKPCVPNPSVSACIVQDEDGDGYSPSYSEDDSLYDPDDSDPCVPNSDATACLNLDDDGDGIPNRIDSCIETPLDELDVPQFPTEKFGTNRYLVVDGVLVTNRKSGLEPSTTTLEDTDGCSCEQILDSCAAAGAPYGQGHYKFGCARSVIEDWARGTGRAGVPHPDGGYRCAD